MDHDLWVQDKLNKFKWRLDMYRVTTLTPLFPFAKELLQKFKEYVNFVKSTIFKRK